MKRKCIPLQLLGLICLLLSSALGTSYAAPSVKVYATGTYTDTTVDVYLSADILECNLISFGVKLGYNPADLTVVSAVKNENAWYLGENDDKNPYMSPDTSTAGEVVIIGGKLDINAPAAGVTGGHILLGHISFQRNNSNMPDFSLTFGKNGTFKNFVTTGSLILDDQIDGVVVFDPVIPMTYIIENGRINISGAVTYNSSPVCAMVLANGQYMFTCSGDGSFSLNVPLDSNGQITVFSFVSGLAPYKEVIYPLAGQGMQIQMDAAGEGTAMDVSYTVDEATTNPSWVRLTGNITYNGSPVCAMALANGQYMFTCSGDGSFDLELPLDSNGDVTLYGFCSGLPPYKEVFSVSE